MSSVAEAFATRLAEPSPDLKGKLNTLVELRDSVELHQATADYPYFVKRVLPELTSLLNNVPVSFQANSLEHKVRHAALDIIVRSPTNDTLRPEADDLLKLIMNIISTDNEENGILCMKIFTNLHKAYKSSLVDQVQPFFDVVIRIFKNIPDLVNELFNQPSSSFESDTPGTPMQSLSQLSPDGSTGSQEMPRALMSFKVLTECPIIIVLLFAAHRQLPGQVLTTLVPHIIETIILEAAPQAREHATAQSKGEIYTGVSPAIKNRAAYNDFLVSQIKIMSFLAYTLRAYAAVLQNYYSLIPNFVVRLLKDCPAELSSARKELLVSIRHVLSTEFRTYFISKVDVLLEERVLIGVGLTAQENLLPLAYSIMADLIHHVRNELSVAQVWKAVSVYHKNLHNLNLATSFQIMSGKLLLNFLERIMSLPDRNEGRQIMVVILRAFVDRLTSLNRTSLELVDKKDGNEDLTINEVLSATVIKVHPEMPGRELKDAKFMYRSLMGFVKNLIYSFKSCNPPPPHPVISQQQWQECARGFTFDDINLFRRFFREGIKGLSFFSSSARTFERYDSGATLPAVTSKDEKELMDTFASIFLRIDPAVFNEILEAEIEFFYQQNFKNPSLLHIAQVFLGSEITSTNFSALLLHFLMEKLPDLGGDDAQQSNILLRLFKLCFMGVNLFPATNEAVLLPHLRDLIVRSLKLTTTAKEPIVYFYLLRSVFRSIGGGRFETLYKAVLPLLQALLELLNKRLEMARKPSDRDIYVELCLTVPVRLSLLVPHLSHLMRPLVEALNGNPELVNQGLRTLELCVDNLTANYFDPIIQPVLPEVMKALWKHLKPLPYYHQHSHTTLRILGKLGGRNRAFLSAPDDLESVSALDNDCSVMLRFTGLNEEVPIQITPGIKQAIAVLESSVAAVHRKSAFTFLTSVLKQIISPQVVKIDSDAIRACVKTSTGSEFDNLPPLSDASRSDYRKRSCTTEAVEKLLQAVFFAASVECLSEEAETLVMQLCEHLTLLELGEFTIEKRRAMQPFSVGFHEGLPNIEPRTLLTAILYGLCHYEPKVNELAKRAIMRVFETGKIICGDDIEAYRYPMIRPLFAKLSHGCFEDNYHRKSGAVRGLTQLLDNCNLPYSWLKDRQVELVRTLFFVIKDVPHDVCASVKTEAAELLYRSIKVSEHAGVPDTKDAKFMLLSSLLAYELCSSNVYVRETSKKALEMLAEVTHQSVSKVLSQVTNVFLNTIFGKPLRALPFPMQIGSIDVIAYCMELPDTFLKFNDKMIRLLEEAVALVDAEDESLTSAHRVFEYNTAQQLVDLRVVCIRLLSLASMTPEEHLSRVPDLRVKVIAVYFKSLSSTSKEVAEAAYEALRTLLGEKPKLPRDLLQSGLRPILVNISDFTRLSVPVLQSLARLLELLTYYFKVEIGSKFLDHLKSWAEASKLHLMSSKSLVDDGRVELGVAIVNVFHLLPPNADMYIQPVVDALVSIESSLRRVQSSPFRAPVALYLNTHSQASFNFFKDKFTDPLYGRLLVNMLQLETTGALQTCVKNNFKELQEEILRHELPEDRCTGICNLIFILDPLTHEEWFSQQEHILKNLVDSIGDLTCTTSSFFSTSPLHLEIQFAMEKLQELVALYTTYTGSSSLIMYLVESLAAAGCDYSWSLIEFFFENVAQSHDVELRNNYLMLALDKFSNSATPEAAKIFLMKHLVNSTLIVEIKRNGDLSKLLSKYGTNSWLDKVHHTIWQPAVENNTASSIGKFQFLLLEMSVLIVNSSPQLISDGRKDLIKFGWSFIKYEDCVSKISAYVLIASFIAAYDTLAKIVVQIYVALFKTHQLEAKHLVSQALEILAPVLKKRVNSPLWAKWPRRILGEDGNMIMQVINIYSFIASNPDLFYEYRDHFVPFIVTAIAKMSHMSNVTVDIDLAELLAKWEKRARSEEGSSASVMTFAQRETIVTYLVRSVCSLPQRTSQSPAAKRVLNILDTVLDESMWPDVEVKLNFFEHSLTQSDISSPSQLVAGLNSLEVICLTLKHKSKEWIRERNTELCNLLERSMRATSYEMQVSIASAVKVILSALDPEDTENQLFKLALSVVQDHLTLSSPITWVPLVQELVNYKETAVDGLLPLIVKAFGRGTKDIIDVSSGAQSPVSNPSTQPTPTPHPAVPANNPNGNIAQGPAAEKATPTPAAEPITIPILTSMLDLITKRLAHLADQRRTFLSALAQLIERCTDKTLALHIVKIVRGWIFSKSELFLTIKEKAALLHKMIHYDALQDVDISRQYYTIIIDVFKDESLLKTELPSRLEQPFLIGTQRCGNQVEIELRSQLLEILAASLDPDIFQRLVYIVRDQNWEPLAEHYWINQALQLLWRSVRNTKLRLRDTEFHYASFGVILQSVPTDRNVEMIDKEDEKLEALIDRAQVFVDECRDVDSTAFVESLCELQYRSKDLTHAMWLCLFPQIIRQIGSVAKFDFSQKLVLLLAKEYHTRQADMRPNVVKTMLEALNGEIALPPKLVKVLAENYGAWFAGFQALETLQRSPNESPKVVECNLDALAELYSGIEDNDMFYGLWRTRSRFNVTSAALSYEQCGMWSRAMQLHETAQIKARSGVLPFCESECAIWEDHWIICTEKLQHWDVLTELAKHEGFNDLLLECGWRIVNWMNDKEPLEQSIKSLMDVPTPRRQVFETFFCLQGFAQKTESLKSLSKHCDEGIQLALRKWHGLPKRITGAHIPLLHTFQQYVEFMEASQIYTSLASTTAMNLEHKSQELKGVLQGWHERVPNRWDDINLWSDLVTWRQYVFDNINKVYLPLIPALQNSTGSSNSVAYRGYHEIAWIINRFAHVARKHNMPDVCVSLLSKIYTLPNIEIQEAFLKLREQAKCHYANPNDVSTGLDVISNTNLAFFGAQQKSEFFTLKGMSLARLGDESRANEAFSTAVQIDVYIPKAWAEWGRFNDKRFQEHPESTVSGATAMSCYLQAAGLYKNRKARKLLGRILWLLSLDDETGSVSNAFENYKGEVPVWYWCTYIPQLLNSLGHKEARHTKQILIRIAKLFPQALQFPLRTLRKEYIIQRSRSEQQSARVNRPGQQANAPTQSPTVPQQGLNSPAETPVLKPWDHVDEVLSTLKTSYPLLSLSLETLVDQLFNRFKTPPDEEAYRLIVALLNDAMQYVSRQHVIHKDTCLPPDTEASLLRFVNELLPDHIKQPFMADFIKDRPNLEMYVNRLRKWRDRFEERMDARPSKVNLESFSPPLCEYQYQRFEDVEVPGQNLELMDNNLHFVKIDRFLSEVDYVRGFGVCHRRLTIRGHDGSTHPFAVQYPAPRHARREERVAQLLRILSNAMTKRKECRCRNLQFTLPQAVPLDPQVRLVQDSPKYVSFYQIYERFCKQRNQNKDGPLEYTIEKLCEVGNNGEKREGAPPLLAIKMEIISGIESKLVPSNIMRNYFLSQYRSYEDFWLFLRQFAYQYACTAFICIFISVNSRYPHKFFVNMSNGNISASDLLPNLPSNKPTPSFMSSESVPFRLTPNIQTLLGPVVSEGIFAMTVMIIAKSLTEPEFDLGFYLPVFVRDEVVTWYIQRQKPLSQGAPLRDLVRQNVDHIVKRTTSMGHVGQGSIPANQTVIDLISMAVNPRNLAVMDALWMAYY